MRSILVSLIALVGFQALACEQQEMQFMGFVENHRPAPSGLGCEFTVDLTMANPSYVCPLVPGEVSTMVFKDQTCFYHTGSEISGVIVRRGDEFWIE